MEEGGLAPDSVQEELAPVEFRAVGAQAQVDLALADQAPRVKVAAYGKEVEPVPAPVVDWELVTR